MYNSGSYANSQDWEMADLREQVQSLQQEIQRKGKEKRERVSENHLLVQTEMAIMVKDMHIDARKEQGAQEKKIEG